MLRRWNDQISRDRLAHVVDGLVHIWVAFVANRLFFLHGRAHEVSNVAFQCCWLVDHFQERFVQQVTSELAPDLRQFREHLSAQFLKFLLDVQLKLVLNRGGFFRFELGCAVAGLRVVLGRIWVVLREFRGVLDTLGG